MKFFFKKIIYDFSIILLKISGIFNKSHKATDVLIRMVKPLGIGDVIMLSPIFYEFEKYKNRYYVTDIPLLQQIDNWEICDKKNQKKLNNDKTLLVLPSYTLEDFLTAFFWKGKSLIIFDENKIMNAGRTIIFKKNNFPHYSNRLDYFNSSKKFIYPNLIDYNINTYGRYDIVLFPYVNWESRQWPLKKWKSLIDELLKLDLSICLLGSNKKEEIDWNKKLENNFITNLTGKLNIESSVHLMSKARLLICHDSGPFHIGCLINGLKIISIFGCTTSAKSRIPFISKGNYLETIEPTNKCNDNPYNGLVEPKCKNSNKCIDQITVENVFEKVIILFP